MITKKEVMSINNIDELEALETQKIEEYRNKIYNNLLKDDEIKKHIAKIFKVELKMLPNVLMINGNPPPDDFNEDEI